MAGDTISYGPVSSNDVVSSTGQTINLPTGNYSTLTLFADAVKGDQTDQPFTIVYSKGVTQTFTRSLTNWLSSPGYSDELQVEEMNAYNPDGSKMSQVAYDSAYALPLNPTLTIKSIILPNDSNIKILAMALYHDGATAEPMNLSSSYNRNGFTYGGRPITDGGLDGHNDALGAPASFSWQGTTIPYGPVNGDDVVSATGQPINLPAGKYSTLTLFADAVNNNQTDQSFTVVYSNGVTQTFTRSLTNWLSSPGYSDELRVEEMYAYNPDGSKISQVAYDSAYALPLDPALTIKSIILPNDSNIEILGMLLS